MGELARMIGILGIVMGMVLALVGLAGEVDEAADWLPLIAFILGMNGLIAWGNGRKDG